jgi:hypothetical protein
LVYIYSAQRLLFVQRIQAIKGTVFQLLIHEDGSCHVRVEVRASQACYQAPCSKANSSLAMQRGQSNLKVRRKKHVNRYCPEKPNTPIQLAFVVSASEHKATCAAATHQMPILVVDNDHSRSILAANLNKRLGSCSSDAQLVLPAWEEMGSCCFGTVKPPAELLSFCKRPNNRTDPTDI